MSASTSQSKDVKVEKGAEGELKKTISAMTSSSAETTTRKDDDKSTFRGPDSGNNKLYKVEELKKLKVTLEVKKRKSAAITPGAAVDLSTIAPVRRRDQVSATEEPSSRIAEEVGESSEGPVNITEGKNEPVIEELKISFPTRRKHASRISENAQFVRASKHHKKDERDRKEYDAIGYAMSKKLLRMDSTQAIYAESLMNKILEMGLLEELSSSTKIKNDRC